MKKRNMKKRKSTGSKPLRCPRCGWGEVMLATGFVTVYLPVLVGEDGKPFVQWTVVDYDDEGASSSYVCSDCGEVLAESLEELYDLDVS